MPIAIPIAIAAASLISKLFKHKGEKAAAQNAHDAQVNQLTLQQKMGEDKRLGKLGLGSSILSGLNTPGAAYGGHIQHNSAIDPAVLANLSKERTYDFSKAVGDPSKGMGWNFAGDAVGTAGSALGSAYGTGAIGGGGAAASGAGSLINGLFKNNASLGGTADNPYGGLSGGSVSSGMPSGTIPSTGLSFDELLKKPGQ